jgi:hypothetical protein
VEGLIGGLMAYEPAPSGLVNRQVYNILALTIKHGQAKPFPQWLVRQQLITALGTTFRFNHGCPLCRKQSGPGSCQGRLVSPRFSRWKQRSKWC